MGSIRANDHIHSTLPLWKCSWGKKAGKWSQQKINAKLAIFGPFEVTGYKLAEANSYWKSSQAKIEGNFCDKKIITNLAIFRHF